MSTVLVPAVYLILRRGERVLLQRRAPGLYAGGCWSIGVAGHIEDREPADEAAIREAREEVGVRVAADDLEPRCVLHRLQDGNPVQQRVDFIYECRWWAGRPQVMEPDKASEVGWFRLDALPGPMMAHEAEVLRRLRARTLPLVLPWGFGPAAPNRAGG